MKEYRVVCDVEHLKPDGTVSHTSRASAPYGTNGLCGRHVFDTREKAQEFMQDAIGWGNVYCARESAMREKYPQLYSITRIRNYRIQCRNVTEWK